jgi:hypothetical protein
VVAEVARLMEGVECASRGRMRNADVERVVMIRRVAGDGGGRDVWELCGNIGGWRFISVFSAALRPL